MAENIFGLTDVGKVRDNNEDTFVATLTTDGNYIIACVIDGVGGYAGGEIAAEIARTSILQFLGSPKGDIQELMKAAINHANEEIFAERQQNKDHDSMACVLTLAVASPANNQLFYAHVGDTRLYLLRDGSLIKITSDHSFVGFMEESGRLSEESAMRHPKRNEINKALGFGSMIAAQEDYIEIGESPFLPGDTILLCSDGLTDMVGSHSIKNTLSGSKSLREKAQELVAQANENGGKDNITVVLAQNNNAPREHQATKPIAELKKKPAKNTRQLTIPDAPTPVAPAVTERVNEPAKQDPATKVATSPPKKSHAAAILACLCLILLIFCVYLLWKRGNALHAADAPAPKRQLTQSEIKLEQTINNSKSDTVVLTAADFPEPIVITNAILISRNALYLKGAGNQVLVADSASSSPALSISASSTTVVLDGINFKNFNVAIQSASRGLTLKDVRFFNCTDAVRMSFMFDDGRYVNGSNGTFKTDSLPTNRN